MSLPKAFLSAYPPPLIAPTRHPKVIEDERAVEVALRLEERPRPRLSLDDGLGKPAGRRMKVTAVGSRISSDVALPSATATEGKVTKPPPVRGGWGSLRAVPSRVRSMPKLSLLTVGATTPTPAGRHRQSEDWTGTADGARTRYDARHREAVCRRMSL